MSTSNTHSPFAQTRWTLVLRARGETPEARMALGTLCDAYYPPVFRFLCREGRDEESARELTQEFFVRILQRNGLAGADPARGQFRSYLLGALKHFLADHRKYETRGKRGGGAPTDSIDAPMAEGAAPLPETDVNGPTPDTWFDRQWASTVMDHALKALEHEFSSSGKTDQFKCLKPWLVGDSSALSQTEVAERLDINEGAVKVAIHRLRKRFRQIVRAEIAHTVADGTDIDAELRYLIEVLSASGGRPGG